MPLPISNAGLAQRHWIRILHYVHAMQALLPGMAARRRGAIAFVGQGGKVANPSHLPGGSANAVMLVSVGLGQRLWTRESA